MPKVYTLSEYAALPVCKKCGNRLFPNEQHPCLSDVLGNLPKPGHYSEHEIIFGLLTGRLIPIEPPH